MPKTLPEVKAGDRCPVDGGEMRIDPAQDPERVIERNRNNAHSPFVAKRFEERVRDKVAEFGVIHKCVTCGYRSRFQPAEAGARDQGPHGGEPRGGGGREGTDRDQTDRGQTDRGQTDRDREAARSQGGGRDDKGRFAGSERKAGAGAAAGGGGSTERERGYQEMNEQASRDAR